MYWPATTAVASGTTGLETESVPGVRVPATAIVPVARTRSVLPCTEDPDLYFAESPQDVETAKAMCQQCPVRNDANDMLHGSTWDRTELKPRRSSWSPAM